MGNDHDHGHHDEPPHQAPWVFYATIMAVSSFLIFFLAVKFLTS